MAVVLRSGVHLILHFLVPCAVARRVFPDHWKRAWLIMVATMVVDLDHLLADPVYDANRCSVGFHPLHGYIAIVIYSVLTALPQTRPFGLGLLIHMLLDGLDCLWI
jgi:hypothetical protein